VKKSRNSTNLYIKASPFQKWTFYKCPNPKKLRNNYIKKKSLKFTFLKTRPLRCENGKQPFFAKKK